MKPKDHQPMPHPRQHHYTMTGVTELCEIVGELCEIM